MTYTTFVSAFSWQAQTAGKDADVECGLVADEFERAADEKASVVAQFLLANRVRMPDDLVRIGRAAINHRAVAVGFKLLARRVLGRAQRGEELRFIPWTEEKVLAPLGVRVFYAVLGQLRPLLDCGGAGHIAKPAGMGTTYCNVECPIRETFVNKVILCNHGWRMPHPDTVLGAKGCLWARRQGGVVE